MQSYSMTCSCGDELKVDAENREAAVEKLQAIMNEDAIKAHMAEKHPDEEVLTVAQIHDQIEEELEQVELV